MLSKFAIEAGHFDYAEIRITEGDWDKKRATAYVLKKVICKLSPWLRIKHRQTLSDLIYAKFALLMKSPLLNQTYDRITRQDILKHNAATRCPA